MTQRIEIHVSGAIPEGDEFAGHEAVLAARDPTTAVVKALEANGLIDVKATCRLVNNKHPKQALRAVPQPETGEKAA